MPRRRELAGVAKALLGSFTSRNNDVDGYWGMGRLASYAEQRRSTTVQLTLVPTDAGPADSDIRLLLDWCNTFLGRQLAVRALPRDWLRAATVAVTFGIDARRPNAPPQTTRGRLAECIVEFTDDLGNIHRAGALVWCGEHDPARERRCRRGRDS